MRNAAVCHASHPPAYCRGTDAGWSSPVARKAHNLEVAGSNPAPATNIMNIHDLDFIVYILKNAAGRRYFGMTSDMQKRLIQHNAGGSEYTRWRGPWNIFWQSFKMSYDKARALEKMMKNQKGGKGLQVFLEKYGS